MVSRIQIIISILFLFSIFDQSYAWRNFSRFKLGTEANGVGGAYVGDASSELAMFYNPAGLVQLKKKISVQWEASTGIKILDILGKINIRLDRYDYFSFFSFLI